MSQTEDPGTFRITGRHFLIGIVAFFTLVIGADIYFATLAYRTFSGEAAHNPYEAGLLYNRTLEQDRAAAGLGWRAAVDLDLQGRVTVSVLDRTGQPVEGLKGEVVLTRPATEASARSLRLRGQGDGLYQAEAGPHRGAWDARLMVSRPGDPPYRAVRRIVLK